MTSKPKFFPKFSSYIPGYTPWFIDEPEARLLLEDLQKTSHFAKLARARPEFFESRRSEEFPFFPESSKEPSTLDQFEWHLVAPQVPPADPPVELQPSERGALLNTLQVASAAWELIGFYSRDSIGEPPRPYFPKLALSVDSKSGMVLGFSLGTPRETMAEVAAGCVKKAIATAGHRPALLKLNSVNLFRALAPFAEALEARLLQVKSLPVAEEARRSLEAFRGQM